MTGTWLYLTEATTMELQALHRPEDLSVVHCAASVADKTFPQAVIGLLKALGKDENVTGMRMHPSDGVNVLPVWLAAHNTQMVVLSRAQVWRKPGILSELLRVLAATPATVVVATDPDTPGEVPNMLRGMCPTPIGPDELTNLLPPFPVPPHTDDDRGAGAPMKTDLRVEVPPSDWGTFRFDCRDALPDAAFARIDAAYVSGFTTASTAVALSPPSDGSTLELLTQILHSAEDTATATAAFRGTQAAYFKCGYNLRLDPAKMISLYAHTRPPEFTERDWLALRAYRDPARPATCTLYAQGLTVEQIRVFSVADAEQALDQMHLGAGPLPRHAAAFIAANLIHRNIHGATPDDAFIPLKSISHVLSDAGRDVGILTAGKPVHSSRHTQALWTAGTGFLLKEFS